jgi:hypothetical protein
MIYLIARISPLYHFPYNTMRSVRCTVNMDYDITVASTPSYITSTHATPNRCDSPSQKTRSLIVRQQVKKSTSWWQLVWNAVSHCVLSKYVSLLPNSSRTHNLQALEHVIELR